MLINLKHYHRPRDLQNALYLLQRPSPRTVPLAGGSSLIGSRDRSVEAVVDLQELGLRYVRVDSQTGDLLLGSMATLGDISRSAEVRNHCGGIVAQAAHRSAGSVLRNQATLGGAIAVGGPADELLVALLACDAQITAYLPDGERLPLTDFLARRHDLLAGHGLITEVSLPRPQAEARASFRRVARTPADAAIVCAAAVLSVVGQRCTAARLALGGVAETPCRVPEVEAMLTAQPLSSELIQEAASAVPPLVNPPSDHSGQADYRRTMAGVLSARVLLAAMGQPD
jgi:carbon-monoxide dehydrogenase medium subunit